MEALNPLAAALQRSARVSRTKQEADMNLKVLSVAW